MAKHLTKDDISSIISIIDGWDEEKLTWDKLCEESALVVGKRPTRQSLNCIERIKEAFNAKKSRIRVQNTQSPTPSSLTTAADRIYRLQGENNRLAAQNSLLLEKIVQWQYNAYKNGLVESQLNEPLPRIDRSRTNDK